MSSLLCIRGHTKCTDAYNTHTHTHRIKLKEKSQTAIKDCSNNAVSPGVEHTQQVIDPSMRLKSIMSSSESKQILINVLREPFVRL